MGSGNETSLVAHSQTEIMSWLKSLLRMGSRARLVGTDLSGNQYFERVVRGGQQLRRSVKLKGVRNEEGYTQDSIPPEWDRWLRGLRNNPPLHEELLARAQQSEMLKQKVADVNKKDAERQAKELAEGLTASGPSRVKAVDHASAPSFRSDTDHREDPTSTGKTFQPASWKP